METDFSIHCPYCGEEISVVFYPEEGSHQEMIIDCEVCCNPIFYEVTFKDHDSRIRVERAQ